jgi:hypothetical protein
MKLSNIFGLTFAALLLASSCSDDVMDRINIDEQHPSLSNINGKFLFTDAQVATSYSVINGSYAWYVSSYTEQEFGTGNNQLKNAEVRKVAELASSTTFNNEWNSLYSNLNNINAIIGKCQPGGVNSGHHDLLGMAQTLMALNLGVLTDLHGDVPFAEALGQASAPKVDKQQALYDRIFELLDSAQINLAQGGHNVDVQDLYFAGDLKKWQGFAHALKARYKLHTYGVNKAVLTEVLAEAEAAVKAGFEGCNLDVYNGKTADNSWSAYQWSRYYVASSKTVDDLMLEREDPREPIYNYADGLQNGNGEIGTPGDEGQAELTETLNFPAWLDNGAAYQHIFSKSELYFILAEAKARQGQDAKADFQAGVKASMADYDATGGVDISDEQVNAYLDRIEAKFAANPLNEIFVQKYLAQTRDEQIETYNDIRRCTYADGSYAVKLTNPKNTVSGKNRWPLRLPYGDSDVVSNPNVASLFGTGNEGGMYIFTDPVWWAGGK